VNRIIQSQSEADTAAAGCALASQLRPGTIILISGDLGAGKTAFVRGVAEGLGVDPADVSSPTFTLIQEYSGGRVRLQHVDLYRLTPAEADDLGLDELTLGDVVTAIEWPDRLTRPFDQTVRVDIRHGDADARTIIVSTTE
jgi:tRNA threonylcarbamoyladenosine biosynthesis protein TsaE